MVRELWSYGKDCGALVAWLTTYSGTSFTVSHKLAFVSWSSVEAKPRVAAAIVRVLIQIGM
jgi:hypothetical protein